MEATKTKIATAIVATAVAMFSIIYGWLKPELMELIFSIEVILLPTIYIVGNMISESYLHQSYTSQLDFISLEADKLNTKYYKERMLTNKLKEENRGLKNVIKPKK